MLELVTFYDLGISQILVGGASESVSLASTLFLGRARLSEKRVRRLGSIKPSIGSKFNRVTTELPC